MRYVRFLAQDDQIVVDERDLLRIDKGRRILGLDIESDLVTETPSQQCLETAMALWVRVPAPLVKE